MTYLEKLLKKRTKICRLEVLTLTSIQNENTELFTQIKVIKKLFFILISLDCRLCKIKRFWQLVLTFPKRMWQHLPSLRNIYPEVLPLEWNEMKWNEMKYIQKTSSSGNKKWEKQVRISTFLSSQARLTHCPTHTGKKWYRRCLQDRNNWYFCDILWQWVLYFLFSFNYINYINKSGHFVFSI